jgi:23S rRNA (uracil1939-C5)-methyltransferase
VTEPVRILRIAAGGDGVGRLADGRVVFIPRTAPGDLVEADGLSLHARFARARAGRLLEAGPDRVDPPCAHYLGDACGGCQLQHLNPAAQRAARRAIAGDALRRIGRFEVPDPELETGEADLHYRSKITLTVRASGREAGFHRLGDAGDVFDLRRCEIAAEPINRVWRDLRGSAAQWPPALRQIVLRQARDGSRHIVLRGPIQPDRDFPLPEACALWWERPDGTVRQVAGPPAGSDGVAPGTFEQVHPAMGRRVRSYALQLLGTVTGRHVWDLYAGIGETTAALLAAGASVESVEADSHAVSLAERLAHPQVRRVAGLVEEWAGRLEPPWAVVTNPPRTGMDRRALTALSAAAPLVVVYVSCDPATLARDLATLRDRYRITTLRGFDLFPQTAHIETVVRLDRQ